ncbi:VCBS repeat-containing protein [Parasediminibacterium paludis]|uniref:VCBS repeat-containing protein n=1 Tax=Parasediminibacterium paludis TaxID=908966 RepID=A0ABV8PUH4_9BACT
MKICVIVDKLLFRNYCQLVVLIACAVSFVSCHPKKEKETLFQLMDNDSTGIHFENTVIDNKDENSFQFRNFYNGGGVALGDINNDGLPDVVLTSNLGNNKIYLNKGNFKFDDITATSGFQQNGQWSTGVTFVDINADGWLDIYICSSGHVGKNNRLNQLYINNHDNTFTESAKQYGLDHSGYSTQAVFFDYDKDGDLDCFIIDNSPIPFGTLNYQGMRDSALSAWKVPEQYKGGGNHLYRNTNQHFEEVSQQAGIHSSLLSFGLGVSVADVNGDGYPDIYVGNDFLERDYLYINQKNGTFKDELETWMQHISMSSMGTDIVDINNDGYPDIYTTDMLPPDDYRLKTTGTFDNVDLYRSKIKAGFYHQYVRNCLQLNNRNGKFIDIANATGVSATDWSWGLVMFDADNDGYNDIYVCNGINRDLSNLDFLDFFSSDMYQRILVTGSKENIADSLIKKIPQTPLLNKAYRNKGNLQFEDIGEQWGFTKPSFSNTVAYADLDNDGDLDMIVNNENQPAFVYKNNARQLSHNNFISVSLKGNGSNTFAIGTIIKIYQGKEILSREIEPVRGFQSSVDYKQTIGLGKLASVDSLVITWPDLSTSTYIKPPLNKSYTLLQTDAKKGISRKDATVNPSTLFQKLNSNFEKHQEDDVVDFYAEQNIPEMLSREGPQAAIGDVNGDGRDDIFIGGATNQAGQLYLQNANGTFTKKNENVFAQFADFEDVATLFFDSDGDGDLDLFVGAGGNNTTDANSRELQHRLYKNDGKGNFSLDASAFPLNNTNIAVATACDFDNDGDLDLFVGSRSVPLKYGVDPTSHIYVNDGKGHFTDLPQDRLGGIANIGMVTSAVWADVSGDAKPELIIVGEWMAPRIFTYKNQHFQEVNSNLTNLFGWWRSIVATDVNGDGKTDLVIGNIGHNFYLHPDEKNPVKLWVNDFDQNGTLDKIMTHTVDGKDMTVFLKHELEAQLPILKKQNLLHEVFSRKAIQALFPGKVLSTSLVKKFNYTSSIVAINKGKGQFEIQALPFMAQLSCINAMKVVDVNEDGFKDIVYGGNDFDLVPQFGRLDASLGGVLLNDGKGHFSLADPISTGILERGEIKDIKQVLINKKSCLLILQNNEKPVLYQTHSHK